MQTVFQVERQLKSCEPSAKTFCEAADFSSVLICIECLATFKMRSFMKPKTVETVELLIESLATGASNQSVQLAFHFFRFLRGCRINSVDFQGTLHPT